MNLATCPREVYDKSEISLETLKRWRDSGAARMGDLLEALLIPSNEEYRRARKFAERKAIKLVIALLEGNGQTVQNLKSILSLPDSLWDDLQSKRLL